MDCLFIHGNYPAQFKYLAPLLARAGHRVVFLTNRADADQHALAGVLIRKYVLHRGPSEKTHHYLISTEETVLNGQAVVRALNELQAEEFEPRFVVTHGGMGLGLFIKDIFPKAIHIGYFEWYFQPSTTQHLVAEFNLDVQLSSGLRNLPILQELERCDVAVVPTHWQKQQFPDAYHKKISIIFDGIDSNFFYPEKGNVSDTNSTLVVHNRETGEPFHIEPENRILSYATRGMETLRGFPEFMRTLPKLFDQHTNLKVIIAGADRRAYSFDAPSHNGSWKRLLMDELGELLPNNRVLFTGLLDYPDYRSLLWRSNLHCYFTRPYVTSWSLFEAGACAARLAINLNPATYDIVVEDTAIWVDLDNHDMLTQQLSKALSQPGPRAKLLPGYDLNTTLKRWEELLNRMLQSS